MSQACNQARRQAIPVAWVTRQLSLPERTARRWRQAGRGTTPARSGRPPQPATIAQRNAARRFLSQGGAGVPLYALRREFPEVRRADLQDVQRRFRRVQQRRQRRRQSRLDWRCPGTVWAADFKERREPLEGRYRWILSIKDLASRYQLAWLPLEEATAEAVQTVYRQLFEEHGPPLVMKSDNGGQFRDEGTKALLAAYQITPLYNPSRHPSYNGGVERANGQLAGYQEALAAWHGRPGLPTCDDAASARHLANDLARSDGLRGPTARELWAARLPIACTARGAFLATVERGRAAARTSWDFAPDELLTHYPQAAVDRRAVRDALVAHDLLHILPRHPRRGAQQATRSAPVPAPTTTDCLLGPRDGAKKISAVRAQVTYATSSLDGAPAMLAPLACLGALAHAPATRAKNSANAMLSSESAGRIELAELASSMVGEATSRAQQTASAAQPCTEEATSSTDKLSASGQHYG
ncbi:MAG: transposase family protein [Pirellulales bacterium]